MVKMLRAKYADQTLLLDAGDQFQGTLWFYTFGGIVTAEFMNHIGYDAMGIGNHEFDEGIEGLEPFARKVTFPLLSSNMNLDNTPKLKDIIQKSTVLTVNGQKIGLVGYTTAETPYISRAETVTFSKELEAVQAEVDRLTQQGVNKIIAVGHVGFPADLDLAKRLRNVDVIVGGHTNTFLYNGTAPSNEVVGGVYPTAVTSDSGQQVLVVQGYAYGKYLGELHVTFNDEGIVTSWWGNPILLDKSVQQDPETLEIIAKYTPAINKQKTTVVGQSYVDLLADVIKCRTTECNLGNLVADAMLRYNLLHTSDSWSEVSMSVVNAGSFRASINTGNITTEAVIFVQPFRNTVDIVEVSGQTIKDMFEYCAEKWTELPDKAYGGFLQVAGLQVTYDVSQPVGSRVVELLVTCTKCKVPKLEPISADRDYKLVTSSFILNGGDGLSMFPKEIKSRQPRENLDTDIMIKHIVRFSPITTGLEGRIRHVKLEQKEDTIKGNSAENVRMRYTLTPVISGIALLLLTQ
ncbi:unnamed protein product [Lymnaea stagnalis]|uniref:5'-nucleotidase n=1 Tax=Lymnaea stagnalis TaxID=6523 RepID=A0AAV2HMN1_LYMST